jgi:hypothetical protein
LPYIKDPVNTVTTVGAGAIVGPINGGYYRFAVSADATSFSNAIASLLSGTTYAPDKINDFAKRYRCVSAPGVAF